MRRPGALRRFYAAGGRYRYSTESPALSGWTLNLHGGGPMIDTTQAFFAQLAARGYEPLLHSVTGAIRLDIEDAGSWFVAVNYGALTLSRATVGAARALA